MEVIDPKRLVAVRAIWGSSIMADSHAKALWDMRSRGHQFSSLLKDAMSQTIVAFGESNARHASGSWPESRVIFVEESLPEEYKSNPPRRKRGDRHNRRIDGVSTWWHKLQAIRIAMNSEPKPLGIIWLDWDCMCAKAPDESLCQMLESGPIFQGCNTFYGRGRGQCPWRGELRHTHYNGGCYYIRAGEFIDLAIELHASRFQGDADEVPVTYLADAGGWISHNPLFYTSIDQEPPGSDTGYFRQGPHISLDRWIRQNGKAQ